MKLTREFDEALIGTASEEKVGRLNVIYEQSQNKFAAANLRLSFCSPTLGP